MQFLAFLKDSYREARSGWMLQIMLVLSTLLILIVASIGFRPVTLEEEMGASLQLMNRLIATNPARYEEIGKPELAVENFTTSNKAQPWKADYTFEYVIRCPSQEDMAKARKSGLPISRDEVRRFLRSSMPYIEAIDVEGGPPELNLPPGKEKPKAADKDDPKAEEKLPLPPKEARYIVHTRGTTVEDQLAWRHQVSVLFFYEIPFFYMSLREGVYLVEKWLVNGAGAWVAVLVSIIITAGFIPTMLGKGSLDLLVSKPIGRPRLLAYKYVGGLTFIFMLTTYTVLGVWLMIGLRSGIWTLNFLALIPIITFYFAILYAVSTLAAVLTRSTIVAILATGIVWAGLWVTGKINDGIENRAEAEKSEQTGGLNRQRPPQGTAPDSDEAIRQINPDAPLWGFIPKSTFPVFTAIHAMGPRTYQLDNRLGRLIAEGVLTPNQLKANGYGQEPRETWGGMLGVSTAFIGVMLGLAIWRFVSRDS